MNGSSKPLCVEEFGPWPFARYRFRFKVTSTLHFPEYAGSKIRGIFGRQLRKTSCMTKMKECSACPLKPTCPYTTIFETAAPVEHKIQNFSQIPHGYIFEAPLGGEHTYMVGEVLQFDLVLVGKIRHLLALIIYSIQKGFERGIGYGSAQLTEVLFETGEGFETIYLPEEGQIREHRAEILLKGIIPSSDGSLRLDCLTTLRLQRKGCLLDAQSMDGRTFLMALVRRIGLLMEFYDRTLEIDFEKLSGAAGSVELKVEGQWSHWKRYSTRQKQLMDLAGIKGQIVLNNVDPVFYPFLELGTLSHVGKNASFGLGKYRIVEEVTSGIEKG